MTSPSLIFTFPGYSEYLFVQRLLAFMRQFIYKFYLVLVESISQKGRNIEVCKLLNLNRDVETSKTKPNQAPHTTN